MPAYMMDLPRGSGGAVCACAAPADVLVYDPAGKRLGPLCLRHARATVRELNAGMTGGPDSPPPPAMSDGPARGAVEGGVPDERASRHAAAAVGGVRVPSVSALAERLIERWPEWCSRIAHGLTRYAEGMSCVRA
jgi:hypothetical protein